MTTWPSNQTESIPTIAGYIPPTVPSRPAFLFDPAAPTAARQPYMADLAWSAEPPEYASPLPIERRRPWFVRTGVLTFVAGGLVAAAAAGLFGALHSAHSTRVDMTNHVAPPTAPAAAPMNPAPMPVHQTRSGTATHSVRASRRYSRSAGHQSPPPPPQYSTPPSSGQNTTSQQAQSDHDSVSTPPTWNPGFLYWLTHRHDHDDTHWTHDSGQSSHDQSSDNGRSN